MKSNRIVMLACLAAMAVSAWAATPKYVFYFIGDGMGVGQVQSLRTYFKNTTDEQRHLMHFYQFPVMTSITTYSADDDMTDSAAAGTALATGTKTRNNMLGMDADTTALTSVAKRMKAAGRGVAVMSSVCLDDATPGAFYASRPARSDHYEIARQGAASGFDFLAGAYFRDPYGVKAGTPGNVFAEYQAAGYDVVRGKEGYDQAVANNARRILWLDADTASENTIGYAVEAQGNDMTLPQMVAAAIDHLQRYSKNGFFIMAEGGAIDHLSHSNDAAGVIREAKEFDAAVRVAYDFYRRHPKETLIIVTADHETGGMALGVKESKYKQHMDLVQYAKVSKNRFLNIYKESVNDVSWQSASRFIADNLGLGREIPLTPGEEGLLMQVFQQSVIDKSADIEHTLYADFDAFTTAVYKIYSEKMGIGWTTHSHTGNTVPLFAIGAGAEQFALNGWLDNTDVPKTIARLCRLK